MGGAMRIAFAITRATSVGGTWTTVHLAHAALERGDTVRFIEPWDYEIDGKGRIIARSHAFDHPESAERIADALVHRTAPRRYVDLERIDLLMLRAAPLDLTLTTFAELVKGRGIPVVNDPAGLVSVSHKAWLASLQGVPTPPSVVTRSRASCHLFAQGLSNGVVVKPARGSGGRDVSMVNPRDSAALDMAFDQARLGGDGYVVVQAYLPAADYGEKRLVWLDGQVIGGYLRNRAPGEFRHNLKRGAQPEPTEITTEDFALGAALAPHLARCGIRLAGLDVIGGTLIEVNALNPGGAFHADRLTGSRLCVDILERLTQHPGDSRSTWALHAP